MIGQGFIGPMDKWEYDLKKLTRDALFILVDDLIFKLYIRSAGIDRETMPELIQRSKKYGAWDSKDRRSARFIANPEKIMAEMNRRSKAAKKAAKRRKRRSA